MPCLAQHSAAAIGQFKSQVGTSATRVEHGSVLVDPAVTTKGEVVCWVQLVADIAARVDGAAEERSAGVTLIAQVIMQVDQGD